MQQPTLATPRLILRPFRPGDAPRLEQLVGAREIADTTLAIPHPYPAGMAERWIATRQDAFESGTTVSFAIALREPDELCGGTGMRIAAEDARADLGYWIGVPYWGRGYATEAARAMLRYGFEVLQLNRIVASHFPRNPASGRIMQKIGMTYEGCLRQHVRKGDRFEDLVYYGILRDDWRGD